MPGKKKLLIADDDKLLHRMYADGLGEDYEILHAYDGADTLILAVEHRPDVILLDIMMPLLDGRTVCRKIKENARTKNCKVIIVTGRGEQSDRLVGFEVGADEYVTKPVSLAYLSRAIGKLLP
jgi:DNA-binding response OmpR family regulator